jgi:Beta-L-arabinofuranosidase, GH127 catalytic domain/Beta-L-arabinofuranosidase, GH127 middle domain/F5/8 type C domain
MRTLLCSLPFATAVLLASSLRADVRVVSRPDTEPANRFYPGNHAPLLPSPLLKLPVGTVRPEGWLRKQLELQGAGFHGHLTEISKFLRKEKNAWLDPKGQGSSGWEEVPYWLKGFGDCAYLLENQDQIKEAKIWIEGALASQREDGFFGPRGQGAKSTVGSTKGKYDLWPNMIMLDCLQSYYEYSGDKRVVDLMEKYFQWELAVPEKDFLPPYWQQQRAGDNLWSVYWLYARTGEAWLLKLADKIYRHTANWTDGVPNWHNVNMSQAFGGPTFFYPQSKNPKHLEASERNYQTIRRLFGQVPGGMFGGDENCRPGYVGPRQAIETCGMVEMMYSDERLIEVTGNLAWADRCEDVAFNSLPAALTADLKALRYLTAPNLVLSDKASKAPELQNGGPMLFMNPYYHRCCQHNFGHGWPYFTEHLWMATPGQGLAAVFYGPSRVTAQVGDGAKVTMTEQTHYPFEDEIEFVLATPRLVTFPLYLRVPGWSREAGLTINGDGQTLQTHPLEYIRIDRAWADGDRVRLRLPMEISLRTWATNQNSVSVDRGPLTYSLKIGEKYVREGGTDAWPAWEIHPTTPWNYGLILDAKEPANSFQVVRRPWPSSDMPFTIDGTPLELAARGKRIPQWQLDPLGLVGKLQPSPVRSDQPAEDIRLIPMGAARLRIASFPVIGEGPTAHVWTAAPAPLPYHASASHCNGSDTVLALMDRRLPERSSDQSLPRFTWWNHKGSTEWVQYDFESPRRVSGVEVYWFDDTPKGGCGLPQSWRILYREDGQWKGVSHAQGGGLDRDQFNPLRFDPVQTAGLRLEVQLQPDLSGGILEWKVE